MRLLVDMNLSPSWLEVLREAGHEAAHWSDIGPPAAPDTELFLWARTHDAVLLTSDLDFAAILAGTGGTAPSVVQVRMDDLLPGVAGPVVLRAIRQFQAELERGALISIDPTRARARVLPL